MLGNICNKSILVRFICVIMLVIIQFDVYGYDFIYASHHSDINTSSISFDDEQVVSELQLVDAEWSDPLYKNSTRRYFIDIICIMLIVTLLLPIVYNSVKRKHVVASNCNLFDGQEAYLRFRVLLI